MAFVAVTAAGVVVTPAEAAVSKWSSVSAGSFHTCGIKTNGSLWCWGLNQVGQLGIGSTNTEGLPTRVGTGTNWAMVDAGDTVTCALTTNGTRYCWGNNFNGQLGVDLDPANVANEYRTVPTSRSDDGAWSSVSALSSHGCGVKTDGLGYCWGDNTIFQFGNGSRRSSLGPTPVGGNLRWNELHASYNVTCGIDTSGTRYCWGSNDGRRLGLGNSPSFFTTPTSLPNDGVWTALSTDIALGCGLSGAKRLYCFGAEPTAVTTFSWRQVSVGQLFTCGITSTRSRFCTGLNNVGQLGLGHTQSKDKMTSLEGDGGYLSVSSGRSHACGISTTNRLYCWGENKHGELGDGTAVQRNLPVLVS